METILVIIGGVTLVVVATAWALLPVKKAEEAKPEKKEEPPQMLGLMAQIEKDMFTPDRVQNNQKRPKSSRSGTNLKKRRRKKKVVKSKK